MTERLLQPIGSENIKKLKEMYENSRFKDCDLNFLARIPADHPIYTDQFVVISRKNKQLFYSFVISRVAKIRQQQIEKYFNKPFRNIPFQEKKRYLISNISILQPKNFFKMTEKELFLSLYEEIKPQSSELYSIEELSVALARASSRVAQMKKLLENHIPFDKIKKVGDIGCGNGLITKEICKQLFPSCVQVDMYEPFVNEDTRNEKEYENFKRNFIKEKFDEKKRKPKYDCIFLITALHHVMNPLNVLDHVYKSLGPGGFLIIREHQPTNDDDKMYLDLQEKAWNISFTNENNGNYDTYTKGEAYPEAYFTKEELYDTLQVGKRYKELNRVQEINYEVNGWPDFIVFQKI